MKFVCIESPYSGYFGRNIRYAQRALRDCIDRGEAPYASHLLYPLVLSEQTDRRRALDCAQAVILRADILAVYIDYGISDGMKEAIRVAEKAGVKIEYRKINKANYHSRDHVDRRLNRIDSD